MTVNEMIYKTLTTKGNKEPKYKEVLEALGYKLNNTHDWSSYDYWGIEIPSITREGKPYTSYLLFSKDRQGKKRLYITTSYVKSNDFSKIDYVNLIKIHSASERLINRYLRYNLMYVSPRILEYKYAKDNQRTLSYIRKSYESKLQSLEEEIEKTKHSIAEYDKQLIKANDRLLKALDPVREYKHNRKNL